MEVLASAGSGLASAFAFLFCLFSLGMGVLFIKEGRPSSCDPSWPYLFASGVILVLLGVALAILLYLGVV